MTTNTATKQTKIKQIPTIYNYANYNQKIINRHRNQINKNRILILFLILSSLILSSIVIKQQIQINNIYSGIELLQTF